MNIKQKTDIATGKIPEDAIALDPGFRDVETWIFYRDRVRYVIIQGSESIEKSLKDWVYNLLWIPWWSNFHGKFVHLGHYLRLLSVKDALIERAFRGGGPQEFYRTIYLGHSMGATIAGLFATEKYCREGSREGFLLAPSRAFYFTRPSVENIQAYRYGSDIVPFLPPWLRAWKCIHIKGTGFHPFMDHMPAAYREAMDRGDLVVAD